MKIKYFATYRELTGCKEAELPAPPTARALLELLAARYGQAMAKKLFTDGGEISREAILLINGRHIEHLQGGDTPLSETDVVSLFPMVAGG